MSHHPLFLTSGLLCGLGDLAAGFLGLGHALDDTNSDGLDKVSISKLIKEEEWPYLSHVTHGKTSQRWVVGERLNTHWLRGNHLDNGSITRLDEFWSVFNGFTGTTIDLLQELREFAGNVGSMAIEHWRVPGTNLAGVVENNDLGSEGVGTLGRIVLRVTSNVTTTNLLDGNVLDVETNVVSWETLGKLLVMHLDGLDFSGHICGSEGYNLGKKD